MADGNGITRADLVTLEERTVQRFAALEERMMARFELLWRQVHDYVDERTRDMQTELLRGFRVYQENMAIRMAKLTADVGNSDTATDKRLNLMEERLLQLEQRIAEKGL